MGSTMNSSNSLRATVPDVQPPRIRPKEAAQLARCSVGTVYVWIHAGHFRTWVVRQRGKERGIRYIDRESFTRFLDNIGVER
jgi:Helix-turn-helix domain